jgi:F0F1-type ATP synthase alpha subunit
VVSIRDGIARDSGLDKFQAGEMVEFARGVKEMALNLENEKNRIAIVGTICTIALKERDTVTCTGG